jgi:hypothetical protein
MKRITALAVALMAIAVVAAPVAALAAETDHQQTDPNAKANFHGKIKVGRTKATLKVTYNCNAGQVLWISAKEVSSGRAARGLTKESSSKISSAWWQSHRNPITCDSQSHTATFSMDKKEKGSKGTLKPGQAWVQFCVTNGDALVLSAHDFVTVTD